jgi:hypothetical protein
MPSLSSLSLSKPSKLPVSNAHLTTPETGLFTVLRLSRASKLIRTQSSTDGFGIKHHDPLLLRLAEPYKTSSCMANLHRPSSLTGIPVHRLDGRNMCCEMTYGKQHCDSSMADWTGLLDLSDSWNYSPYITSRLMVTTQPSGSSCSLRLTFFERPTPPLCIISYPCTTLLNTMPRSKCNTTWQDLTMRVTHLLLLDRRICFDLSAILQAISINLASPPHSPSRLSLMRSRSISILTLLIKSCACCTAWHASALVAAHRHI